MKIGAMIPNGNYSHVSPSNVNDDRQLNFLDRNAYFLTLYDSPTKTSIPTEFIQDEQNIGHLHFNNVTWITSHNAHANRYAAGESIVRKMASNQEWSIYRQLKEVGVRGLMLDIQHVDGGIMLAHGLVEYSWLDDIINYEIIPFLEEDKDAIITLDVETLGDREMLMRELRVLLQQTPGFTSRIFRIADDNWKNHTDEWPTVQEMRDADQRVVIFSDDMIVQSEELGIMLRSEVVTENHWLKGLDKCSPRNEKIEDLDIPWTTRHIKGKAWTRLFTLNHFCCATGIESLQRVKQENIGGGDNGWGILYPRVLMCMEADGLSLKPNYLAVDWAHIGDAHEVADYLNFGGRLGTGQPCKSGLDCATGACNQMQRCHCQICETCNGCGLGETCIPIKEGVHECTSNSSSVIISTPRSNTADTIQFQSLAFSIVQALVLLRLLILS